MARKPPVSAYLLLIRRIFAQIYFVPQDSCGSRHFTEFDCMREARHANGQHAQTRLATGELHSVSFF